MTAFFRFPHTSHLAWLGAGRPRDDKVLGANELRDLLAHELIVEEKVDGANLGFSVNASGTLCAQNRGAYLSLEGDHGQWKPLKRWCASHAQGLKEALFPDLMLFGEWCYAAHSIHYTRLPDWFLAFDVYDRAHEKFWSVARRNALAVKLGISVVPMLGSGVFNIPRLRALLGASRLTESPVEGIYVRREFDGHLVARAKLVRQEFIQSIEHHWSKKTLQRNIIQRPREHKAPLP